MESVEPWKKAGKFTLPSGEGLYGELCVDGANSYLYLRDERPSTALERTLDSTDLGNCVAGVLHDLTKVSLFGCVRLGWEAHTSNGADQFTEAKYFPHYVITGPRHIAPADKTIVGFSFVVDDADILFSDLDAFGVLNDRDARSKIIEQIIHLKSEALRSAGMQREIAIGPNPIIAYYTGKREIFSANTVLGQISAVHAPSYNSGGAGGVRIANTIYVTVQPTDPITFDVALVRAKALLRYLAILAGRPQHLLKQNLRVQTDEMPVGLQVFSSFAPKRDPSVYQQYKPHASDVLIDAVRQPDSFSLVLRNWLAREESWYDARVRFSDSFAKQGNHDRDRLIGAANMFDILPSGAVPRDIEISAGVQAAKESSMLAFQALPKSPERDSVLSALGRVGKANLKRKIRHRGELIIKAGAPFRNLFMVTDAAVDCRNHYVHGSDPPFSQ